MNYPMYQNPYYMPMANPYQVSPYVAAMQQTYNTQPQQTQQTQNQQQITTQPPIMQPQNVVGSKILPVTNKEEATVALFCIDFYYQYCIILFVRTKELGNEISQ